MVKFNRHPKKITAFPHYSFKLTPTNTHTGSKHEHKIGKTLTNTPSSQTTRKQSQKISTTYTKNRASMGLASITADIYFSFVCSFCEREGEGSVFCSDFTPSNKIFWTESNITWTPFHNHHRKYKNKSTKIKFWSHTHFENTVHSNIWSGKLTINVHSLLWLHNRFTTWRRGKVKNQRLPDW